MYKILDKIFCWQWWPIIKWPFGALLLWIVLIVVWNEKTTKNYDQKVVQSFKNWSSDNLLTLKYFITGWHDADHPLFPSVKTNN